MKVDDENYRWFSYRRGLWFWGFFFWIRVCTVQYIHRVHEPYLSIAFFLVVQVPHTVDLFIPFFNRYLYDEMSPWLDEFPFRYSSPLPSPFTLCTYSIYLGMYVHTRTYDNTVNYFRRWSPISIMSTRRGNLTKTTASQPLYILVPIQSINPAAGAEESHFGNSVEFGTVRHWLDARTYRDRTLTVWMSCMERLDNGFHYGW